MRKMNSNEFFIQTISILEIYFILSWNYYELLIKKEWKKEEFGHFRLIKNKPSFDMAC